MYRLPRFFCPKSKTKLIRLGKPNDGGYCIPEKSLDEANILFSFGLDEDWSFEEHFKKKVEAKIICFDNSVNNKFWIKRFLKDIIYFDFKKNFSEQFMRFFTYFKYKKFIRQKNVHHIKKHINSNNIIVPEQIKKNFINLQDILKDWGDNCFFLKMDIEGNEYNILDDIIQNQKNMIGMVIEFHSCDLMSEKIKLFIEKLNLDLVHIHVNNYGPVTKDRFPTVIELTFSAKKYNLKREENENNFPVESFDQPNNKNDQDAPISFI